MAPTCDGSYPQTCASESLGVTCNRNSRKKAKDLVLLLLFSFSFFTLFSILRGPPADCLLSNPLNHQPPKQVPKNIFNQDQSGDVFDSPQSKGEKINDKLLGGLLPPGFKEVSCQSRYQSNLYRRIQPRLPTSYLVSRLRKYEALHKQCGPSTDAYNKTLENLRSGREVSKDSACKYVIYIPDKGLANRMLTTASTFLYALLTNRVLLIGYGGHTQDLFCEPFPEISWLLPSDFPIDQRTSFNSSSPHTFGDMLENDSFTNSSRVPPFMYIYLAFDYGVSDKLFFCDQQQLLLQHVPWLLVNSDQYFAAGLFLIQSFQQELNKLFPEKETVFHHLGRYLFHPSNSVWGLITRYYEAYLAKADDLLGVQIRVYPSHWGWESPLVDQILACSRKENRLPEINKTEPIIKKVGKQKTKAVLITSLTTSHYEEIKEMYWKYAAVTGEAITVYQPSHEERQKSWNQMHERKALADIYLLSFSDKLMVSAWSTFGYVAQSLGGLRPWILPRPFERKVPNPPCKLATSMEACYHRSPVYCCGNETRIRTTHVLPYLRGCEDTSRGLKLFD